MRFRGRINQQFYCCCCKCCRLKLRAKESGDAFAENPYWKWLILNMEIVQWHYVCPCTCVWVSVVRVVKTLEFSQMVGVCAKEFSFWRREVFFCALPILISANRPIKHKPRSWKTFGAKFIRPRTMLHVHFHLAHSWKWGAAHRYTHTQPNVKSN